MMMRIAGRGAIFMVVLAVAACSSSGERGERRLFGSSSGLSAPAKVDQCAGNKQACIYKGRYERNERAFAEAEARRLNQEQLERLLRASR